MNKAKPFLSGVVLGLTAFAFGCGSSDEGGTTGDGSVSDVSDALNQEAPEVDIPGGTATGGLKLKSAVNVAQDDGTLSGGDFSFVLDLAEQMSQNLTQFAEHIFYKGDDGTDSLISTIIANGTAGARSMGPIEPPGENFAAGIMFQAFEGCASDGTLNVSPTSSSPLAMTLFMGASVDDMTRVVSACVRSVDPLDAEAWMQADVFINMFEGGGPSVVRVHLTAEDGSLSTCPFTSDVRVEAQMFQSGDGTGQNFSGAPVGFSGLLCQNSDTPASFLVAADMDFNGEQEAGPCGTMDSMTLNLATDGTEVAGSVSPQLMGELITIANGGINPACTEPPAAIMETAMELISEGLCADAQGASKSAAACSVDDNFTLLTAPNAGTAEVDTAFPADAPTTFSTN